ncbi:MAG: NAD(P)-dependent dehydrogenase (short-subunit alcohol dehydrogenase family) [Limisphaerales bacterium]|jgi:NAD(P)-dependent dehydrogenase (short-subunit alcohol dehydrogenase family)
MKTILVTGAGRGLGAAICAAADGQGLRVAVLDQDIEAARSVTASLTHAVALQADVCDPDQIHNAIGQLDSVDILVNNAGILATGPLIDHDPADFRRVLDVNLHGVFVVAQAAARRMRDNGGGSIINIASINGIHPSPNCGAYAASKGGVMALTQHMSIEWGTYNIRVNALAPGFVDAGMSTPFYENDTVRQNRASAVPLGRLGTAADIAAAALFLGSDEASYITGQTLAVDGGVINSLLQQLPRE